MADSHFYKPQHSNGPEIKIFDLGTNGPFAEAASILGWDSVNLQWVKVAVDSLGQLKTTGGGGSGGGGQQYAESGTVSHTGTGNLILGESTDGIVRPPTVAALTSSTAMAVMIVDSTGGQITSFGTSTTTVVQGTASNLNATVVGTVTVNGTVTNVQSGTATDAITGNVTVVQSTASNLQATVQGTVTTTPSGTQTVAGTVTTVPSGTQTVTITGTETVVGTITSVPSGTQTVSGTIAVSNTTSTATLQGVDSEQIFTLNSAMFVVDEPLRYQVEVLNSKIDNLQTFFDNFENRRLTQAKVGPQLLTDGATTNLRLSKNGALIVQDANGRYTESVLRGRVYSAQSAITASSQNTACTGLILYNPINSGFYLVLLAIGVTAASTIPLDPGVYNQRLEALPPSAPPQGMPSGTTTAPNVFNNIIGLPASRGVGIAYTTATFANSPLPLLNVLTVYASNTSTGTPANALAAYAASSPNGFNDVGGMFVIAPGGYIAWGAGGSTQIVFNYSFHWEEIPIT